MIKIRIHPLFFLLGLALFFLGSGFVFVAYTIAVVMHEMGHSAAAARMGYALDDIRLMPYGAQVSGGAEGMKPYEEILAALAGPAANLALAVVFTALWWLAPATYFFTETFVAANLVNALFNLIPVFPLDGGRVTLALLSLKFRRGRAVKYMRVGGLIAACAFIVLFLLSMIFKRFNPTYGIIGVFIFASTFRAAGSVSYSRIYALSRRSESLKQGLPVREIVISGRATLFTLSRLLTGRYYYKIEITDDKMRVVKRLSERELDDMLVKYDLYTPINEILNNA